MCLLPGFPSFFSFVRSFFPSDFLSSLPPCFRLSRLGQQKTILTMKSPSEKPSNLIHRRPRLATSIHGLIHPFHHPLGLCCCSEFRRKGVSKQYNTIQYQFWPWLITRPLHIFPISWTNPTRKSSRAVLSKQS